MGGSWSQSDGSRLGAFVLGGVLAELRARDLEGGGFGGLLEAWGSGDMDAVVKAGRNHGGSRAGRVHAGSHHPDCCYAEPAPRRYATVGVELVDDVLEREAALLDGDGGALLPQLLGRYLDLEGRPVVLMERLSGARPSSVLDLARVLAELGAAAERGSLPFHGDLKPEHIFVDRRSDRLRLIDPAPRLEGSGYGAHTPEYNPQGLTGVGADTFAVAVMVYELLAGTNPFAHVRSLAGDRPIGLLDAEPVPVPSLAACDGVPEPLGAFVDEILDPAGPPAWIDDRQRAEACLRDAIARS